MEINIVDKILTEVKSFEEKKQKLVGELRSEFPNLLKPLFDKSPKISYIKWSQYTPFFNDGDECTFSSYARYAEIMDVVGEELDYGDPAAKEIQKVLGSISDDLYKDLFGDHVEVSIHNDGTIEIKEFEHD